MSPAPGADRASLPEAPSLSSAAGGFTSSAGRFARALGGLFGLELRETGAQALILVSLAVAFIAACVFAYLFLLAAVVITVVHWLGGGWPSALLGMCVLHAVLAAILLAVMFRRGRQPLFPATREALRRELDKIP